jgi:hypothetical protein
MIHLDASLIIAKGGHRTCYQHPNDSQKCIKTLHQPWQEINRRKNDPFRHLRKRRHYDENLVEHYELKKLKQKLGNQYTEHFPQCFGFIETNQGQGLITDRIRDPDGKTSPTLQAHLRACGQNSEWREAIDEYWNFLHKTRVLVRDPLPRNLMVQRTEHGKLRIIQIDGFGCSDFLPFSRWIPALTLKKQHGRRKRMERKIDKELKRIELNEPITHQT